MGESMKSRFALIVGVVLIGFFALAGGQAAGGQATTSLLGSVADPSGGGTPNATVHLINTGTNAARTAMTDAQGEYIDLQVEPGPYRLEVDATGFSKYAQTSIELQVNRPATVNVKLKLGQQEQTVTVTESAPVINNTDASEGNTMGQMQLEQLPIEAGDMGKLFG